jgi:hypothetical protein
MYILILTSSQLRYSFIVMLCPVTYEYRAIPVDSNKTQTLASGGCN